VLVKVEQRSKEEDRFEGPYEIVGKVHDRIYKMKNNTGRVIERNVEKIKTFFKGGMLGGFVRTLCIYYICLNYCMVYIC